MEHFIFNFPKPKSFYLEGAQSLYSLIVAYSIIILLVVLTIVSLVILNNKQTPNITTNIKENWVLECLFVCCPFLIVILLIFPSFSLLYSINEIHCIDMIIKVVAHQWYWSYEVIGNLQVIS